MTQISPAQRADVLHRFDSLDINADQALAMHENRAVFKDIAEHILDTTNFTREQSLALTALEEAKYWTNQAIALHGVPVEGGAL